MFDITLKGKNDVVLRFKTHDRDYVKIYEDSLIDSVANCKIVQPWRVYNFSSRKEELDRQVVQLNDTIDKINDDGRIFIDRKIDSSLNAQDINYIHTFFVDAELINRSVTNDLLSSLLGDLNVHLHGLEHILSATNIPLAHANFTIDFDNKQIFSLPNDALPYFTVAKKYGECYANYCQVGRHIFEMYINQDEEAHDDHVLPLTNISSSTYVWLGKSTGINFVNERMENIKKWFIENNISDKVGMKWGDPKLAIGWLPVASLVSSVSPTDLYDINKISNITLINNNSNLQEKH